MKEKKEKKDALRTLLQSREDSLRLLVEQPLRPHGKLWGMDVFTWANVSPANVVATIHAFPFKVIWIGGYSEVLKAMNEDVSICANLHKIIIQEEQIVELTDEQKEVGLIYAKDMQEVTTHIRGSLLHAKILLFTASGTKWMQSMNTFEQYINYLRS